MEVEISVKGMSSLANVLFVKERPHVGGDKPQKGRDYAGRRILGNKYEEHFEGRICRIWGVLDLKYKKIGMSKETLWPGDLGQLKCVGSRHRVGRELIISMWSLSPH